MQAGSFRRGVVEAVEEEIPEPKSPGAREQVAAETKARKPKKKRGKEAAAGG